MEPRGSTTEEPIKKNVTTNFFHKIYKFGHTEINNKKASTKKSKRKRGGSALDTRISFSFLSALNVKPHEIKF
jgi:hypothetical protein